MAQAAPVEERDYRKPGATMRTAGFPGPRNIRAHNGCHIPMSDPAARPKTYLFSDIEGSTRLWETDPQRAAPALARHDAVSRDVVERHHGSVVKMTGDGLHAAFDDPADALAAVIELQQALASEEAGALPLRVRCGLHLGEAQQRDNDFYGPVVNRAARIMDAAHGGQILLSQAVADRVAQRLPGSTMLRDLGAVRLRDLTGAERLYQVVHPQLRTEFPALRSLASTPNNLPQQLNSFIGREREMREIRALLAANRLVTLQAMGGIGKSRLSVQLAAEVLDEYPDGVWLIELAPLSDPGEVAQAIASVLGVKEEASRPLADALAAYVQERRMLLLLDNCEHLVRACADVAKRLLQAAASLKILATSRDVLQVTGETVYHVPPLSVPELRDSAFPDVLTQHEAVRLFVDRAVASQPSFRLQPRNTLAVADICRRLDGIPLAIELAAARTRALPVEAIAARLGERFKLLVTGDQTVLPRQRTLRALIDWSYGLLAESERMLFQRLSVFAGGWTLDAAEAVCGFDGIDAGGVLDLLTSLVEKSLVIMEADSGRYRMLDTVQHYAREKLAESGFEDATRARHLACFMAFAEQARAQLSGADQAAWLSRLDDERENMLAAHRWCDLTQDGPSAGLQLAFLLKTYWYQRGLLTLGRQVGLEALGRTPSSDRGMLRCRGLCDVGQFCFGMGRYDEARGYLAESLAIARELHDDRRIAAVLQPLGLTLIGLGDLDGAGTVLQEGVALARLLQNPRQLAAALSTQGQLLRTVHDLAGADALYTEVIDISRQLGDQESMAIGLLSLAMIATAQQDHARAREALLQALQIAGSVGWQPAGQAALDTAAGHFASLGRDELAARCFGAAEAQAELSGLHRDSTDASFLLPLIETARQRIGAAAFAAAAAQGRQWTLPTAIAEARASLDEADTRAAATPC